MALNEHAVEATSFLPQIGEVTYDSWKKSLRDAERFDLIQATRIAKQQNLVGFRNEANHDGTLTLWVWRKQP